MLVKKQLGNIKIIYLTPQKQLWGILENGVKKRITNQAVSLNKQKLISYSDSKLFKKGIIFNFISNKIKLITKNKTLIIETLEEEYFDPSNHFKKNFLKSDTKIKKKLNLNCDKISPQVVKKSLTHTPFFFNKSPLRYPGGKTKACKILHEIVINYFDLEKFEYIISPFFGGGSFEFFLSNKYGYEILANDISYYLFNFWYICKTNKNELTELLEASEDISKNIFINYKENLKNTNNRVLQAYYFFVLNRCSFNGVVDSGGFSKLAAEKRFTKSSIKLVSNLNLSKFFMTNYDFEIFLTNNKKKNNLIFLDPPYFSNKTSKLYGNSGSLHTSFDHIRLFNYISTKRNWVMTYDDSFFIRNLYKNFIQIETSWSYGMTSKKKKELIIIGKKKIKTHD